MIRAYRSFISVLLSSILVTFQAVGQAPPAQAAPVLNIVVIEGEGAINNIKQRTAREPIVEVQDENHRPVAGAVVLFELPTRGASGTFAQGARTASFVTDQNGRAVATGLRPNAVRGQMQIKVSATSNGRTGSTTITQSNAVVAGAGAAAAAGISLKLVLILAAVGAAAVAGGVYAATQGGGGAKPPTTITPGTPGVGPPR